MILPKVLLLTMGLSDAGTEEQLKMNDCYYDKKDWRSCQKEVSRTI